MVLIVSPFWGLLSFVPFVIFLFLLFVLSCDLVSGILFSSQKNEETNKEI